MINGATLRLNALFRFCSAVKDDGGTGIVIEEAEIVDCEGKGHGDDQEETLSPYSVMRKHDNMSQYFDSLRAHILSYLDTSAFDI